MISLHNITTVAKYEAKILRRSWLFRLFSIGALLIFTGLNIGMISPIGDEDWTFLSIPSSIPYMNLYLLNIAQALIIVFLAADFLKKDKKLDTNEVLYTRSMSNLEYVLGKSWGIIRLFIGINILVLLIALIINIIAKNTYIDIGSYLSNILLISLPTIIFSLGLAYIMMSIIKNQAITFLLLLGYAALDMFYLYYRGNGIFDYMMFALPAFESQLIGYENFSSLLAHRLLYSFAGLSFIFITILIFNRLPQSRPHKIITMILLSASLGGAGYSGMYYYNNYISDKNTRQLTLETNKKYENSPFLTIETAEINIEHQGRSLISEAGLLCKNNTNLTVNEILFSLNPELKIQEINYNNNQLEFSRDKHIIKIVPLNNIVPGDSLTLYFKYKGSINEAYCYPWYDGNLKTDELREGPVPIGKKQVFLTEDYVMLTPEANWYPQATLNYYPSNPARIKLDFTTYTLRVKAKEGLSIISQGRQTKTGDITSFTNDIPVPGISLIIGDYTKESIVVDSIEFTAWYKPGHDYYKTSLTEISDTLPNLISGILTELENTFSTSYPYNQLQLVEVPVQFRSIEKKNTQTLAEVQPAMILVPEKLSTLNDGDFYRTIKRNKKRMERNNQIITDKEIQVRAFMQFLRNSFISGSNSNFRNGQSVTVPSRYLLGPSYYFFKNNFVSEDFPVINAVFESHLQKVEGMGNQGRNFLGGLSESDKANTLLSGTNFNDLLETDPSNDTLRIVLTVKGDYIFNLIRSEAGIEEFNYWFSEYMEANKFKNIPLEQLDRDIKSRFGFGIINSIENWYYGYDQPGFYFTNIVAKEIITNNRTRYQVSFDATNGENTEGIFTLTFRTMGGGRGGGGQGRGGSFNVSMSGGGNFSVGGPGRGMEVNQIDKIVKLDAKQTKRVNAVLDAEPRAISINTLTSINNPSEIMIPLMEITEDKRAEPIEIDIILDKNPPFTEENEIIVDNEDPGFTYAEQAENGRLRKWFGLSQNDRKNYAEMWSWWAPEFWQPTVQSFYYGKYILSALYTRSGSGERTALWTVPLKGEGYYDIYTWARASRGGGGRGGGGRGGGGGQPQMQRGRGNTTKDFHYIIHHAEGNEEVTFDTENASSGWNHLGSFFFDSDSAKVELSNQSEGRTVAADAIRFVKQE